MIDNNILKVFHTELSHIKFDKRLFMNLYKFRIRWANKNQDHISFLGGNLIGVHSVVFSNLDFEYFFIEILKCDAEKLQKEIYSVDGINPDFNVSSDALYLTTMYLVHGFLFESDLSKDDKIAAAREAYYIFAYRAISSLITHYFKYKLDSQVALVVYERLTNRFKLKQLGSWQKLFEYRSKDLIETSGLHHNTLKKFNTDDIVKLVNDVQGRIRETIRNIFAVLMEVIESGETFTKSTLLERNLNEEEGIKSIINREDKYTNYIKSIVHYENTFIQHDLIYVIENLITNLDKGLLIETLQWISLQTDKKYNDIINNLLEEVISISIGYLIDKEQSMHNLNNIGNLLTTLRGLWISSRGDKRNIETIKYLGDKLVATATRRKTKWMIINIRIGLFLYIFLRAYLGNVNK